MPEAKGTKNRLPPWIRIRVNCGGAREEVNSILAGLKLNTVCASAKCPNLSECWHHRTATFMILGNECTRNCKFCAVEHCPHPASPDPDEPRRLAEAAARMNLKFVVVTSVTRDDLPDGGAAHFAAVIRALREKLPEAGIEVLTPDFNGNREHLGLVLAARPSVFNHNVETVERLSASIRSKATYRRTLEVLHMAAEDGDGIPVKSGLMVGLGETDEEILAVLRDLRAHDVEMLTIGQYLAPSGHHLPVTRYVHPDIFRMYETEALAMGFTGAACAPLVRSSYWADQQAHSAGVA